MSEKEGGAEKEHILLENEGNEGGGGGEKGHTLLERLKPLREREGNVWAESGCWCQRGAQRRDMVHGNRRHKADDWLAD
eukprot:78737-Chlamydomonas_euryale.AAC.2